jgi:putative membrane protein
MKHRSPFAALVVVALALAGPAMAKTHHRTHHTVTVKAHEGGGSNAFLKKALQGDNSEMRLGRLAEQQGHAPALRAFGRTLARDHAAARQQLLPVAKAHGVPATTEMAPEARTEYAKLRRMHGWAFDQEFARYMVKDHRKDIADFEKQASHGDRSTRRLAQRTLPTLRKHLRLAEGLARR